MTHLVAYTTVIPRVPISDYIRDFILDWLKANKKSRILTGEVTIIFSGLTNAYMSYT